MESCKHCPIKDLVCEAVKRNVPRYCQLVDPEHPDYNPGYIDVLERKARGEKPTAKPTNVVATIKAVEVNPSVQGAEEAPAQPIVVTGAKPGGCGCGKNRPKINQAPRNPEAVAKAQQSIKRKS